MLDIAVLGSGSWGTAAAMIVCQNGHNVTLWSRNSEKCKKLADTYENSEYLPGVKLDKNICFTDDISCVADKDIVVIATPSGGVREISQKISTLIKPDCIIVVLAKGLEQCSYKTMSEVIADECKNARIAVMSGPSHAEEVAMGMPTLNVVASNDPFCAKSVQDAFMNETFRIYSSNDVKGVELGGALKNVIALCAGVTDGIGFGDNTKAALMTRGISEIARLGVSLGANIETFWGLSGIGDLIVTCTSMHSRNRRAGILIGKGMTSEQAQAEVKMVVEGISTTKAAYELSKKQGVEMPIINAAYDVLYNGASPREAVTNLMLRDKKIEN